MSIGIQEENQMSFSSFPTVDARWMRPSFGCIKLNCDAAIGLKIEMCVYCCGGSWVVTGEGNCF